MTEARRDNSVKVLFKAAAILECFEHQPEWSLTQLSERLGWNISTLHRLLSTLQAIGYLEQEADSRRYRLGLKLVRLGLKSQAGLDLARLARPSMEELVGRCEETVYLGKLQGQAVSYLGVVLPPRAVRITVNVGDLRPLHSTGTGKVLMAHVPPAFAAEYAAGGLERFTAHTITEAADLERELESIRRQGYAISDREHSLDVASIAVPVRDATGSVAAALAISAPAFRFSHETMLALLPGLQATAERITAHLGGNPLAEEG